MNDDTKKRLDAILGTYDDKLAEAAHREATLRAAQAAFPERFGALKAAVVRPTLQEFADALNGHGHEVTLRDQDESSNPEGGVVFSAIILRIIPKPFAHKATGTHHSFIEIIFSANRTERKVTVSSTNTVINSGGSRGKRGEYDLDAVTADVIASHVIQTLQEAFMEPR